jgi:O-methyltransferase
MKTTTKDLYLTLLKNTLAFNLWPEPPTPITEDSYPINPEGKFRSTQKIVISIMLKVLKSRILKSKRLQLYQKSSVTPDQKIEGTFWPRYAHTMIGLKRLDNLQYCVETIIREEIEGDLIEAGVWRGGACIFMRAILAAYAIDDRKVYVADSFQGLPMPDPENYPADKDDNLYKYKELAISLEEVKSNFVRYDLLDDQVQFLKGWFRDTLPIAPIGRLAVIRLDGDMYESIMDGLVHLYPKLSRGGFCIIDDYGSIPASRKAADDYRTANGITADMKEIDWTGWYWRR